MAYRKTRTTNGIRTVVGTEVVTIEVEDRVFFLDFRPYENGAFDIQLTTGKGFAKLNLDYIHTLPGALSLKVTQE